MDKNQRYYISEYAEEYFFHGGIGIVDAEKVMQQMGFQPIRLPHHYNFSIWAKFSRFWYCLNLILSIDKQAIIVFIHPLHAALNKWLLRMLNRRKVKIICMIGDINGLKDGDKQLLKNEIKILNRFNFFIVHNQGMLDWLSKTIPGKAATMIEFFDFLTTEAKSSGGKNSVITFAGNLDKSKFLLQLNQVPLKFNLYGPGISPEMLDQPNVEYHGIVDPYELPARIEGSYGLIWDGESIHEMKGSLGHYMQYISHHKLSLYILSGMPIITSCRSGAAALVKKYRIGICVNSLMEISDAINNIDQDQYAEMKNNMKPIAKKIASGNCLSGALDQLITEMN